MQELASNPYQRCQEELLDYKVNFFTLHALESISWSTNCPTSPAADCVDGFLSTGQKNDFFSCPGGILGNELSVKSAFLLFTQTPTPTPPWRSSTGRPTLSTVSRLLGQCLLLLLCVACYCCSMVVVYAIAIFAVL
jgi:hypothetical protein